MKDKEIVQHQSQPPSRLLEMAIEKDADIEKLEKLMDLQERWEAKEAKKAFLIAMSKFQDECPELKKDKTVSFNQTSYSYVPLGSIRNQIKDSLKACGLSYRWETDEKDGKIEITCVVSHIDGHSERNSMQAEKDASGSKNVIQQRGSTMTYLQRYTLIGALGISTADQDNDSKDVDKNMLSVDLTNLIDAAATQDELSLIWEGNAHLHKNQTFIKAVKKRKGQVK